ncbi:MAG TPA: ATP-binding protein [Albitalea sp.]|nr:ATP-binding protein [Albitalea sp.]
MKNSLQVRLSLWLSIVIVATGLVAAAVSFALAFDDANELQDTQLRQVAWLAEAGRFGGNDARTTASAPSPNAETPMIVEPMASNRFGPGLADGLHTLASRGQTWRVLAYTPRSGEPLVVAQPTALRDEIAFDSGWRTLLPLLALIPFLIVLVGIVVRKAFAPLAELALKLDAADEIDRQAWRDERLPAEVQPFAASIERLFTRLTKALVQQRRFVADAAHELRSPVAALMVQADNLAQLELPPEATRRLRPLKDGLVRTRRLLDQLLSLARHQAGNAQQAHVVRVDQVARDVVADLVPMAQDQGVDLGFARIEPVAVRATPLALATVLRNAIDNALRHSSPGTAVSVDVFGDSDDAVLMVEDAGPGIPEDQLEHVFDPFYRLPGSAGNGSGLGLAIVRSIAERCSAMVRLSNLGREGRAGLRFEYRQRRGYPSGRDQAS